MSQAPLLSYSVEADVSRTFAWQYRTDVSKWSDPPAVFALDGPFEAGSRGTTQMPGQALLHWRVREVVPGERFEIEISLDGAMLVFEWRFEELPEQRTRMTQDIWLSGDQAAVYAPQVEASFGSNLAEGMRRVAAEMEAAERRSRA